MGASLHATKNYRLFELCAFNRDVRKLGPLRESMKQHGWIDAYPMHVVRNGDNKLKIKAGHHRFVVAQDLGIAVKYVVCDDTATIHELERGTRPWSMEDYLNSQCRLGSPAFLAIKEYSERTGIGYNQAASLLAGESASSGNQTRRVKDGTFDLGPQDHANAVAEIIVKCRDMKIPFAAHSNFVAAVSCVLRVPEFDAKTFIHRLSLNIGMAVKQATKDQFIDMIESIYNRQSHQKLALAFLAKEEARRRSAIGKNKRQTS